MTPFLALLFLVPAFSMAGIPPLGGFWGKLFILQEGIGRAAWLLVLAAVVTAFLTLLSMLKVWSEVYWRGAASPSTKVRYPGERTRVLASALLASLILLIGLFPGVLFEIAEAAAAQMADPAGYIAATTEDTP